MSNFGIFKKDLELMTIKANKPLIMIESFDYKFIIDALSNILEKKQTVVWHEGTQFLSNFDSGYLYGIDGCIYKEEDDDVYTNELYKSISWFKSQEERYLIASVSGTLFQNEIALIPLLQEFVYINNERNVVERQTIILVSATHIEVVGLEHICERLILPQPDKDDIQGILGYTLQKDNSGAVIDIYGEGNPSFPFAPDFKSQKDFKRKYEELVDALYGMYLYDIKELLHTIISESPFHEIQYGFKRGVTLTARVKEVKKQMVKNSGLLEVIDYEQNYDQKVGDIDNLREHLLREKKLMFNQEILKSKLPKPKGILLVGAPGCGKSASAIATASILNVDLYRLNIGSLLGHKYGQSENRFIEALHTADASAPCVLWIDEIEKAFAGAGNESENDNTLTHIVGHFLTWMQEHKTMVYLVATANDVSRMKPEMLRKGRWDETFYLVYPEEDGVKKIVDACLEKYGLDNDKMLQKLLPERSKMKKMSGAAIESIIVNIAKDYLLYKYEENSEEKLKGIIEEYVKSGVDTSTYESFNKKIKEEYQPQGYKPASKSYKNNKNE